MPEIPVGAHAPHVTLTDTEKQAITVPEHGHVTVLAFFPAAFTSVCTAEMCTFRDQLGEFEGLAARVYGVSVDSPFSLKEYKTKLGLTFPLLSDHKHEAIEAYDLVFPNLANIGFVCARRSVFVIGKNGNVAWRWLSEHPGQQPDYDAVKKAVAAAATT
jgi:peroxiredoxin